MSSDIPVELPAAPSSSGLLDKLYNTSKKGCSAYKDYILVPTKDFWTGDWSPNEVFFDNRDSWWAVPKAIGHGANLLTMGYVTTVGAAGALAGWYGSSTGEAFRDFALVKPGAVAFETLSWPVRCMSDLAARVLGTDVVKEAGRFTLGAQVEGLSDAMNGSALAMLGTGLIALGALYGTYRFVTYPKTTVQMIGVVHTPQSAKIKGYENKAKAKNTKWSVWDKLPFAIAGTGAAVNALRVMDPMTLGLGALAIGALSYAFSTSVRSRVNSVATRSAALGGRAVGATGRVIARGAQAVRSGAGTVLQGADRLAGQVLGPVVAWVDQRLAQ